MTLASLFRDRKIVFLSAVLCCFLWGSAFPAIKVGFAALSIKRTDIAAQFLFAGWRFVLAGALLLLVSKLSGGAIFGLKREQVGQVTLLGFCQTTLQYVFFYVGVANSTGVKASIMNATGVFFSVILAHFIYRNDRLTARKVIGCLIGFAGVMAVTFKPGAFDLEFGLLGEGFIVIAAFVLAGAAIYGKAVSQGMDPVVMTGWQLSIGGVFLVIAGVIGGAHPGHMTTAAAFLLLYMAMLSAVAFALWGIILKYNPVGSVAVFTFLIPVFGVILSGIVLGEAVLEWKNAIALILVCSGIWLVNRARPAKPAVSS